jgi:5-methylcytosine-specific restriction enzyme A
MPMAAKRPCLASGCPRFAEVRGRCLTHATPHDVATRGQSGWSQRPSDPEGQRLRGRANQERRRQLFAREPLCRACATSGRVTTATVADHVVPLAEGGRDEMPNLEPLCADCHQVKTQAESARGIRRRL